jgi:hypothetical protein
MTGVDRTPPPQVVDVPAEKNTGTPAKMKANPEYADWISRDQLVLSYLLQSLSLEVLPHVHLIESAHGVWTAVEEMFAAQSEAKVDNHLVALANTKKLQMTTSEFLAKMQGFADELVVAGHPFKIGNWCPTSLPASARTTMLSSLHLAWRQVPSPSAAFTRSFMPMINDSFFWLNLLLLNSSPLPMLLLVSGAPATMAMGTTTITMGVSVGIAKTTAVTRGVMIVLSNRDVVEAEDPPEGGAAVGVDGAGLLHGLMPCAIYATRKGTMPKIVGLATPTMMTMSRKRFMPPMAWTQTGTRIQVPLITLQAN